MKAIYGTKIGMTRIFDEKGVNVPVTVLDVRPNVVHQVKTPETDGYYAVQVGVGEQKAQRVNRPQTTHFAKAKKGMPKFVKEIRLDKVGGQKVVPDAEAIPAVGDEISIEGMFEPGDLIDVAGTTIGKGFAGVMKRHNMSGAQTMTHGTHEFFRHGGSIGCRKFPGRVWKNKRMAGHMGVVKRMQERLEVVSVRAEDNVLLVKGSVPGPKGGTVFVRESVKKHN